MITTVGVAKPYWMVGKRDGTAFTYARKCGDLVIFDDPAEAYAVADANGLDVIRFAMSDVVQEVKE